jgi:2-keto-4-pentenoate hydratase/2-oxohepta-3-ene-1,7-dioic acid hydratase in catechol pathway
LKLFRFGLPGQERPGILDPQGRGWDVSPFVGDFDPQSLTPELVHLLPKALASGTLIEVDLKAVRLGPPLTRPGTILCIGLNYIDHAKEAGMAIPDEPILFSKAASALSGPNDPILFAPDMTKLDWEVELGVVIGRPTFNISEEEALGSVFGYTIVNDVSERAWQLERGGQWMKGKSYPSFCPVGPYLVSADEIPDPQSLDLWLTVNGETCQQGTSASMIFPVSFLVSYLSRFCRLQPGDLICTGTPAGVGSGMKPPLFLKPGDEVRLGITGIGQQAQQVTPL